VAQSKEDEDLLTQRLLALNIRLMERLFEAGRVRVRLLNAKDANVWPNFRSLLPPPHTDSSSNN
jgi:hypothetical protein